MAESMSLVVEMIIALMVLCLCGLGYKIMKAMRSMRTGVDGLIVSMGLKGQQIASSPSKYGP